MTTERSLSVTHTSPSGPAIASTGSSAEGDARGHGADSRIDPEHRVRRRHPQLPSDAARPARGYHSHVHGRNPVGLRIDGRYPGDVAAGSDPDPTTAERESGRVAAVLVEACQPPGPRVERLDRPDVVARRPQRFPREQDVERGASHEDASVPTGCSVHANEEPGSVARDPERPGVESQPARPAADADPLRHATRSVVASNGPARISSPTSRREERFQLASCTL